MLTTPEPDAHGDSSSKYPAERQLRLWAGVLTAHAFVAFVGGTAVMIWLLGNVRGGNAVSFAFVGSLLVGAASASLWLMCACLLRSAAESVRLLRRIAGEADR